MILTCLEVFFFSYGFWFVVDCFFWSHWMEQDFFVHEALVHSQLVLFLGPQMTYLFPFVSIEDLGYPQSSFEIYPNNFFPTEDLDKPLISP